MTDFLLELRTEEIPARMQAGARADLEKLFRKQLADAGVTVGDVTVWSTPRRLALIARGLPQATEAVREETKGPRVGAPPQALEGFLRKSGLTQDRLEERDGVYFAVAEKPGRAVKAVLAEAIPAIIRAFPWPKSMRWGAASIATESLRWVRPLSGIVAIFGEELVECTMGDVASGYMTLGHRFHHPGPITIGGADDYQEKLRACHVIVDHAERQDMIRSAAAKVAADAGLALVEDEGLVVENAGLTEWPVPLLGRFDEAFLDVPPEVIQLTARVNQKYFVAEQDGKLANAFVCTANIDPHDGGAAIVDGNRKVLAARLSDARFFWEQDRKTPLAEHAKKLERVTFHEKLGTVADKVERVAKLARWLVEEGIVKPNPVRPELVEGPLLSSGAAHEAKSGASTSSAQAVSGLADLAEQTARLAKADLVTEMVGEFPELQGLMGGYYARAEGLPDEVADAIRDHYKPVGQGDEVPRAPVTVAVSLGDKLDNVVSFFAAQIFPTGSKDPFALRRAMLGIQQLTAANELRLPLQRAATKAFHLIARRDAGVESGPYWIWGHQRLSADEQDKLRAKGQDPRKLTWSPQTEAHRPETIGRIMEFFADRLKVQQREAGVRHDLIDAVFALGGEDDLVRLLARVRALQAFIGTHDGTNLLAAYKRAANILKKEDWQGIEGEIARTGEEDPLAMVDDPDLAPVIAAKMAERHAKELSYTPEPAEKALASLRGPIDRFFDEVTVNDENASKRAARLDLLARFRAAVHNVADFSKIEG